MPLEGTAHGRKRTNGLREYRRGRTLGGRVKPHLSLKEPDGCKHSSFSHTLVPQASERPGERISGVLLTNQRAAALNEAMD
jgi:hypothetical protein